MNMTSHTSDTDASSLRRIALVGALPTADNRGCAALAYGARKALREAFPATGLFYMGYLKPEQIEELHRQEDLPGMEIIDLRFSKNVTSANHIVLLIAASLITRFFPIRTLVSLVAKRLPHLKRIMELDAVFALSGGDSFTDLYGFGRFLYSVLPQVLALCCRVPVVLLPQTIGPFRGTVSRMAGRAVLKRCRRVLVREHGSLETVWRLLNDGILSTAAAFAPDVGFLLDPQSVPELEHEVTSLKKEAAPLIGFNISGLLWNGGYTGRNQFRLRHDYRETVMLLLETLMQVHQKRVLLVPHVFGNRLESDAHACREALGALPSVARSNVAFFERNFSAGEIKWLIGRCDLFVGSRMHACIAALSQGVPALALAYSDKFRGIYESIGIAPLALDLRSRAIEEIRSRLESFLKERDQLHLVLRERIPDFKNQTVRSIAGSLGREKPAQNHFHFK
ncbi:MAG: polysaccharide pyruvyl transferase family protein [Chitinispirillaceae bacterium]|nr:polysaccharide pyruvyl transferase family protein [Chitinispirillaceae bacterium]